MRVCVTGWGRHGARWSVTRGRTGGGKVEKRREGGVRAVGCCVDIVWMLVWVMGIITLFQLGCNGEECVVAKWNTHMDRCECNEGGSQGIVPTSGKKWKQETHPHTGTVVDRWINRCTEVL